MDVRPIRNADDLSWALNEITPLIVNDPGVGTPESDRLQVLAVLIEDYERQHYSFSEWKPAEPRFKLGDKVVYEGREATVLEAIERTYILSGGLCVPESRLRLAE